MRLSLSKQFVLEWNLQNPAPTILSPHVHRCAQTGVVAVVDGKLFKSHFLEIYLKHGIACLDYIHGEFAAVVWDPRIRKVFVIRDHVGIRPIFVAKTATTFAVALNKALLLEIPDVDKTPDDFWMAEYLTQSNSDHANTYYRGIKRIKPAHYLEFDGESAQMRRYWSVSNAPDVRYKKSQDYVDHFLEAMKVSIADRIRESTVVGSELSGGLDSTSVTAVAAEQLKAKGSEIQCFSHIRPANCVPEYRPVDELEEIKEFCKFVDIPMATPISSENISGLDAVDRAIELQSSPTKQTFTMFSDELNDRAAEGGCDTLLSGFGGDECATGHAPSWQYEYMHRGQWLMLLWRMYQLKPEKIRSFTKGFIKEIIRRKMPGANVFWASRTPRVLFDVVAQLDKTYLDFSVARRYGKMFASEGTKPWRAFTAERQHQAYQFDNNTHVSLRLESSTMHAASKGMHISFPLLDRRLLELVVGMPVEQKVHGKYRRYLMRRAMKGYLPEFLRWRSNKCGAAVPGAQWRQYQDAGKIDMEPLQKIPGFRMKKFREDYPKFFELEVDVDFRKTGILYALIAARFLARH